MTPLEAVKYQPMELIPNILVMLGVFNWLSITLNSIILHY
jgi:hypothetical protein